MKYMPFILCGASVASSLCGYIAEPSKVGVVALCFSFWALGVVSKEPLFRAIERLIDG